MQGRLVAAVGSNQQVLRWRDRESELVDLKGKTLIPGINDAHVHPYDSTSFPHAARLNSAAEFIPGPGPTLSEVVELVRQGASKHPPGTWLFVSIGTAVVEDPSTNRRVLDAVAPGHPVLLASWYGHGTFLNTQAMNVMGIGEQEPDPFGGVYDRFPNSNVLTGAVREYAEHLIREYFASQMTDQELISMYESFAAEAAKRGYTSIQEFSVGLSQQRHTELLARADLPVRWRAVCFPLSLAESCRPDPALAATRPSARLRSSGIKWIADGTMIERQALLTEDYADAPGVHGRLNLSESAIDAALRRSFAGLPHANQPMFHSVGDATSDTILARMDAIASDHHWKVRRPRIEHGTLLRPYRFDSARDKGVFVVQNPLFFSLAPILGVRFSPKLLATVNPMRSLLKAGIKVAIGSDSVTTPGNPYLDLFFAVRPPQAAEAVTIEQAVIAYTRTSAEAEFQEASKGTLEPGKLADFVVLSQDIFRVPPEAIVATQAVRTVVDGEVVYDAGLLTTQRGEHP